MKYDITKIMHDAIELGVRPEDAFEVAVEAASALAGAHVSIVIALMADLAHLSIQHLAMKIERELITNFQPQ